MFLAKQLWLYITIQTITAWNEIVTIVNTRCGKGNPQTLTYYSCSLHALSSSNPAIVDWVSFGVICYITTTIALYHLTYAVGPAHKYVPRAAGTGVWPYIVVAVVAAKMRTCAFIHVYAAWREGQICYGQQKSQNHSSMMHASNLPMHMLLSPLRRKPGGHEHMKLPGVFTQRCSQLWLPWHSSISAQYYTTIGISTFNGICNSTKRTDKSTSYNTFRNNMADLWAQPMQVVDIYQPSPD